MHRKLKPLYVISSTLLVLLLSVCLFSCSGTTDIPDVQEPTNDEGGKDDPDDGCIHSDDDRDHKCDECGEKISMHEDKNGDHLCDKCTARITPCSDTEPADHRCDVCHRELTNCTDESKDHLCDLCGRQISNHTDNGDRDHDCNICGENLCADKDNDCKCDGCRGSLCYDENADHYCDKCGGKMCFDSDDRGHLCDVCNESLCYDGDDSDCLCDLCGEYACTNPDHSHLLPVIKVYADGEDCTVNGVKVTTFLGFEESFAVLPLYQGNEKILEKWLVYSESGQVIFEIHEGEIFTPTDYGIYYVVPLFCESEQL